MVQDIFCNKWLQNTRTDTRYFRYYPCIMCTLIFLSKIWTKKVCLIHGKIWYLICLFILLIKRGSNTECQKTSYWDGAEDRQKKQRQPCPGWLSWLGSISQSKGSPVSFPIRAHAWVVGSVVVGVHTRGNLSMFLSHINVSLPFFLPPFPPVSK